MAFHRARLNSYEEGVAASATLFVDKARVGLSTVRDFEAGRRQPIANNVTAMQRAIEGAGIRLLVDQSGTAAGIARADASALQLTSASADA